MVDIGVTGWERGIQLSKTGASPAGRTLDLAFILSVNDLPAARDIVGAAQHNSHILCTVCECRGRKHAYRTDCENWKVRNVDHMRSQAEAWRNAETLDERANIYKADGLRYSELWRLPYWNPTRMVTSEFMHCGLEGIGAYHNRYVLQLTAHDAKKAPELPPAFDFDFLEFDGETTTAPRKFIPPNPKSMPKFEKDIRSLHRLLVRTFSDAIDSNDEGSDDSDNDSNAEDEPQDPIDKSAVPEEFTQETLYKRMKSKSKWALMFTNLVRMKKTAVMQLLLTWRLVQPFKDPNYIPLPKTISMDDLRFVQHVIANTTTPSWVNHVPKNFGEKGAGSIKADEWRLMTTIYLPIALAILWLEQRQNHAAHFVKLLDHTMALFQAITIACRYTTSSARATAYRDYVKYWLGNLQALYPHTNTPRTRTNPHVALHIYDFMLLFGPVLSWWAFPTERLIGELGKINSNDHLGGKSLL
ncbi:hypothetical protein C8R46DRAFT_902729 [Mycena filopes]|nr:hypothetical protein C8R46DRAFT_902729 [Mycena filopes]